MSSIMLGYRAGAEVKTYDAFFCASLFKGLRAAKVRCKKNPLKAAVTVSPTEAAADAAVPEIARRTAARSLRPVQAECRRRRAR